MRSRLATADMPSLYRSAGVLTMPPSTSCSASLSPKPSMSIARRLAKCSSACLRCAGQNRPPVQCQSASPSSRTMALPHTGQCPPSRLNRSNGSPALAGRISITTPTTSGITSPARRTITVSPMRTSLRRDLVLVVQRGVADRGAADEHRLQLGHRRQLAGAPDLDVDVAHYGELLLPPETCAPPPSAARATRSRARLCNARLLTLYTTPSMSNGRLSRSAAMRRWNSTSPCAPCTTLCSRFTGNPHASNWSSTSLCVARHSQPCTFSPSP